jgi:hypothetical protein
MLQRRFSLLIPRRQQTKSLPTFLGAHWTGDLRQVHELVTKFGAGKHWGVRWSVALPQASPSPSPSPGLVTYLGRSVGLRAILSERIHVRPAPHGTPRSARYQGLHASESLFGCGAGRSAILQ